MNQELVRESEFIVKVKTKWDTGITSTVLEGKVKVFKTELELGSEACLRHSNAVCCPRYHTASVDQVRRIRLRD